MREINNTFSLKFLKNHYRIIITEFEHTSQIVLMFL